MIFNHYATASRQERITQYHGTLLIKEINTLRRKLVSDNSSQVNAQLWWDKMTLCIDQLHQVEQSELDDLIDVVDSLQEIDQQEIAFALIITFLVLIMLSTGTVIMTRRLSGMIGRLTLGLNALSEGQTNVFVSGLHLKNEVGDMVRAYNKFRCEYIRTGLMEKAEKHKALRELKQSEKLIAERKKSSQFKQDAFTDLMTGLLNRRGFEQACDDFLMHKKDFFVLMIDIDHFKKVNDTWGHSAGDNVLIEFAMVLQQCSKEKDIIARIGGEEFVILLFTENEHYTLAAANKILTAVREASLPVNEKQTINLSCSIGIAQKISTESDLDASLKRADEALYKAKEQGRNRIVM